MKRKKFKKIDIGVQTKILDLEFSIASIRLDCPLLSLIFMNFEKKMKKFF